MTWPRRKQRRLLTSSHYRAVPLTIAPAHLRSRFELLLDASKWQRADAVGGGKCGNERETVS